MSTDNLPRDARGRRLYSDAEIANALAHLEANGGNVLATAQALSLPESTLRQWKDGERRKPILDQRDPQLSERIRLELADRATGVADRMLTRLETCDLDELSPRDAAVVFGIVTDKRALLLGEATAITEHRTDDALDARTKRARERYGPRKLVPVKVVTPAQLPPTEGDAPAPEGG